MSCHWPFDAFPLDVPETDIRPPTARRTASDCVFMTVATFQGGNRKPLLPPKSFIFVKLVLRQLSVSEASDSAATNDIANGDIWPSITVQRHRNL